MKLYFGAIKGTGVAVGSCCGDRLRLPGLQFHRVAGVDEVLGVNMLKVIEASTAPHLEPGEPQDESVQHLVSVLARGLLRAGAGGTQAIVAGPSSRAQMTSLLGTTALRCGLVTVSVSASSNALLGLEAMELVYFQQSEGLGKPLEGVPHLPQLARGDLLIGELVEERTDMSFLCHGMTVKPLLRRLS